MEPEKPTAEIVHSLDRVLATRTRQDARGWQYRRARFVIEGAPVMTIQASPSLANGGPLAPSRPLLANCFSGLKAHLAVWVQTCADYYRAAALYDALSKLSDAELRRRGLSRSTLAWNIALACDRTSS